MLLGEGKWKFQLDTMFYRGDAFMTVGNKDGEYDIKIELVDMSVPDFSYEQLVADGNTVTGIAHTDLLKGKDLPFSITIEGDTANGFLKVPFMGKIKLKDGEKIA